MRYKDNVLNRIEQCIATGNRIGFEVNRNESKEKIELSLQMLKEELERVRDLVSIEPDEFI